MSPDWNRRRVLGAAAAAALGSAAAPSVIPFAAQARATSPLPPALVRAGRPVLTHGVQSGDATGGSAIVWTRADRPGRMLV